MTEQLSDTLAQCGVTRFYPANGWLACGVWIGPDDRCSICGTVTCNSPYCRANESPRICRNCDDKNRDAHRALDEYERQRR